jgi:hypothetical protein
MQRLALRFKTTEITQLLFSVLPGMSLLLIYLYFAVNFFGSVVSESFNEVELAIFIFMIARIVGFLFVPFLRRMHPQVKILALSLEVFLLGVLVVVSLTTKAFALSNLTSDILNFWLGAILVVVTPYSIYELVRLMYRNPSLLPIIISAAPLTTVCLFLSNAVSSLHIQTIGIYGLGSEFISTVTGGPQLIGNQAGQNLIVSGALTLFFVSMVLYIAYNAGKPAGTFSAASKYPYSLVLMIVGCLGLFAWLYFANAILQKDVLEVLSLPAATILIVLWLISRER